MRVTLDRDWFGPDASLHRTRNNPHEMPDSWEAQLPSGAKVLAEEVVVAPPREPTKKGAKPVLEDSSL